MFRRHRIVVAFLTVAALLFAQLAVASHGCAMMASQSSGAIETPCDHAPSGTNLCASHCDYGTVSLDSAKAPLVFPQAIDSGWRIPVLPSVVSPATTRIPATAAPPPLPFVARTTVLRI